MVSGVTAPGAEVFGRHEFTDDNVRSLETVAVFGWPWAGKAIVVGLAAWVLAENVRGVYSQREEDKPDVRQFYPSL